MDIVDGVVDGEMQAGLVMADRHRELEFRRLLRTYDPRRPSPVSARGALPPEEARRRAALFEGARRGDPDAVRELWARYRCRLILPA